MRKINFKSDFDFVLRLRDCAGRDVVWPDYDWSVILWTEDRSRGFIAKCVAGVAENCYNDNGHIHIVADNHRLAPGNIKMEFTAEIPDEKYPDGFHRLVRSENLGIRLVCDDCECSGIFDAELTLPYIKGDKGDPLKWDEMSEEDRDSLSHSVAQKVAAILPGISNEGTALTDKEIESLFD